MTWVVWRQHRNQLYFASAALAAFAVLLLVTGMQMASQYRSALATCTASRSCGNLASTLTLSNGTVSFLVMLTLAVPALLGLFWGAPLVGRELETGTSQFAWMQSVTRRRWLTAKMGWALLAAAVWGGAIAVLVTWWSSPVNALKQQAFKPSQFDLQGIVLVGYAVFAVALGIAAGTVLRRTLPALAVTLGAFTALRIVIASYLRPHYMTAVTRIFSLAGPSFTPPGSSWVLGQGTVTSSGQMISASSGELRIGGAAIASLPSACRRLLGTANPRGVLSCTVAHGYRGFVTYQPANRYWAFQGIETGIFVALAAVLVIATAIVVTRRDA